MQKFLNECTKSNSTSNVGASVLYKVYTNWCAENGEYTLSNTKFGREVSRYLSKRYDRSGTVYLDIELTSPLLEAQNDFEAEPLGEMCGGS